MTARIAALTLAALAMVGLGACGSGDESSGAMSDRAPEAPPGLAAPGETDSGAKDEGIAPGDPKGADGSAGRDATGSGGIVSSVVQSLTERQIIYTIDLSIATDDVARAAGRAATIATTALGFVADERTSGEESATLTLRVPADDHPKVVAQLEKLGDVTNRSRSTQDVTQEVVDTESRIESQRASIARIRALLAEATNLTDVISIESELAAREADLDALLSRKEQLSGLTSMATITVSFYAEGKEPPTEDDDSGFLAGLDRGWDAFVSAGAAVLTGVGAVLPFAALAALIGVPAYVIVRRRRRTRPARPGTPAGGDGLPGPGGLSDPAGPSGQPV